MASCWCALIGSTEMGTREPDESVARPSAEAVPQSLGRSAQLSRPACLASRPRLCTRDPKTRGARAASNEYRDVQGREEGRARLFRRPRHLGDPEVAADRLSCGSGHLHRGPRTGRGARARAQESRTPRHQAREHLHRGRARGIRARLRIPDVPDERALRGAVPARHVDRAPADRQAPGRNRPRDRGGRRLPRRDGQGQRSGPLRN